MNPYPPPPPWADEILSVGVTGTNGKSSTTRFLAAALAAARRGPVAYMSTVEAGILAGEAELDRGPPPEQHGGFLALMERLREHGGRTAAIEATSATLALGFARAWPFRVGVFTNLGHDHQRTHGSFEHYLASKAQLFVNLPPAGVAVLNAGDAHAELIAEVIPEGVRVLRFAGLGAAEDNAVDLRITALTHHWSGLELGLEAKPGLTGLGGPLPNRLRLRCLPAVQAENAAAALLAAVATGMPSSLAAEAIAACPALPGRFEPVPGPAGAPRVIVDYAHAPEALRAVLASARALCAGTLHLVIGAGGDADASKRGPLGQAAGAADRVILTSDNPRSEDPAAIVADLRAGLADASVAEIELDRRRAIESAIADAGPEDLVLVAGKGHEREQLCADGPRPFDDRQVAAEALRRR